jgi:chromosome partitioning protein
MNYLKNNEISLTLSKLSFATKIPEKKLFAVAKKYNLINKNKDIKFEDAVKLVSKIKPKEHIDSKVNVFSTNKGGVGKTTVSLSLCWYLALNNYKVLAIDLDSQSNMTKQLGLSREDITNNSRTINEVMQGNVNILDAVIPVVPNLDFIASNQITSKLDRLLISKRDVDRIMQRIFKINEIKNIYDFIIFDTHSEASTLTNNAFFVADKIVIVVEPNDFSIDGALNVKEGVDELNSIQESKIDYNIVINKYDNNPTANRNIKEMIDLFGDKIYLKQVIRKSNDFENSLSYQKPLFSFAKSNSNALLDFQSFYEAFLKSSTLQKEEINQQESINNNLYL